MRAVICKQFGDPADLVLEEVAAPELRPGTVRLDVHACGALLKVLEQVHVVLEQAHLPFDEFAGV